MEPLSPYDQIATNALPVDALEKSFHIIPPGIEEAVVLAGSRYVRWIERFGGFRRILDPLNGIEGIGNRCNRIKQLDLKAL